MKTMKNDPDMLEEYDFTGGVRGKYAKRYAEGTNVVVIDPDIVEYFPDHDSVNAALRSLTDYQEAEKSRTSASRGRREACGASRLNLLAAPLTRSGAKHLTTSG